MKDEIAGVILAGGLSRRMGGGDKSLLELAGRPILSHVITRFFPQVARLALNANGDASSFKHFGLPVVADTAEGFAGPLAGVLAALEWAAANGSATSVVSAAGDTPFLPLDLVQRRASTAGASPDRITVAHSDGRSHPVFALWPVTLRSPLSRALAEGQRKVSAFVEGQDHIHVEFVPEIEGGQVVDPFFNINTPHDIAEAERILGVGAK
ncbi:molybdenum cofactor guanylyltransferase MobA [Mesorhizobium sp. A556]